MSSKLCFNCFEKLGAKDPKCKKCGVTIFEPDQQNINDVNKTHPDYTAKINYKKEVEKLDTLILSSQVPIHQLEKRRENDIFRIAILTSLLGLLQIYTARLLDALNAVTEIFGFSKPANGMVLTISGFLYFVGIIGFYVRFSLMRKLYLLANFFHLFVLYRVYTAISLIEFRLKSDNDTDLPKAIRDFFNNASLYQGLMIVFAILYVSQIFFMFRRELVNLDWRGR